MEKMKTFSRTLLHASKENPLPGQTKGTCCMCGAYTEKGNPKKFGSNFTCADYLEPGDVICEYCQYLVKNSNTYRRTMFILTENKFYKFKKDEIKEVLFNLPTDEDFYVYLTQTWQKLGYVLMNKARNTPGTGTVTVVMDYDVITYQQEQLEQYYKIVRQLRECKISKEVISNARLELHHLRRLTETYGKQEALQLLHKIEEMKDNPVWELAIYVSD